MGDVEQLQRQREEIEQFDNESIIGEIEMLIANYVIPREVLIEAYLLLWQDKVETER